MVKFRSSLLFSLQTPHAQAPILPGFSHNLMEVLPNTGFEIVTMDGAEKSEER